MGTGLGRSLSKRAETKVTKAAGSSFQLETVRACCMQSPRLRAKRRKEKQARKDAKKKAKQEAAQAAEKARQDVGRAARQAKRAMGAA